MQNVRLALRIALPSAAIAAILVGFVSASSGQPPSQDLRAVHLRAVQSTVVLQAGENVGTGWVARVENLVVIVTNRHVVGDESEVSIRYYDGHVQRGVVVHRDPEVDIAIVGTFEAISAPALELADRDVLRGERVVLCGHPAGIPFISTEGVIAGAASGVAATDSACGRGRNCIVLDAESHFGNSGGPMLDAQGKVIGMVWGGLEGTSLTLAIHARTMTAAVRAAEERIQQTRARLGRRTPR